MPKRKSYLTTTAPPLALAADQPDALVPDDVVAREFHRTSMSIWRWDRSERMAELGWPLPVQINGRNYRSRRALEAFKARLFDEAVKRAAADKRTRPGQKSATA